MGFDILKQFVCLKGSRTNNCREQTYLRSKTFRQVVAVADVYPSPNTTFINCSFCLNSLVVCRRRTEILKSFALRQMITVQMLSSVIEHHEIIADSRKTVKLVRKLFKEVHYQNYFFLLLLITLKSFLPILLSRLF